MSKMISEKFRPPFPTSPFIDVTLYGNEQIFPSSPIYRDTLIGVLLVLYNKTLYYLKTSVFCTL